MSIFGHALWRCYSCLVLLFLTCGADTDMTALITGGAGFLGRHFTHKLCQAGWHVTVVDSLQGRDSMSPELWPQHLRCPPELLRFVREDYRAFFRRTDSALEEEDGQKEEWTMFLHLATAVASTGDSSTSEKLFTAAQENLAVDNAAFEWVVAHPTKRVITKMIAFHSTVPEEFFLLSPSPSGVGVPVSAVAHVLSKQSGRYLAPALHKSHGLNVVLYEAPFVYGEDMPADGALRSLVQQAISKTDSIVLAHDMTVDFLYVEDVVVSIFVSCNSVFDGSIIKLVSYSDNPSTNLTAVALAVAHQVGGGYKPAISVTRWLKEDLLASSSAPGVELQACKNTRSIDDVIADYLIPLQKAENTERSKLEEEKKPPPSVYSSFQCSGGNQDFSDMTPYNEDSVSKKNKLCKLENVCLQESTVLYFQHPEESRAPDFVRVQLENMVRMGITHDITPELIFHLNVLPGTPMPSHFKFTDSRTWFLILASYSDGVGHHLLDDLFPVLAAMDIFQVPYEDLALIYSGCELLDFYGEICAYEHSKYRGEVCHDNFEYFSKLLFETQAMNLGNAVNNEQGIKCFKSLVVGQNYVFNVDTVDKQRAVTLRKGRDLMMNHLYKSNRIGNQLDLVKDKFYVLVLPKNNPGFQEDALWPSMCEDVHSMVQEMGVGGGKGREASVHVVCNPSGMLTRELEMALINQAAMIVAEHGTLSLLAGFYGGDGTVLITVGSNAEIKSAETLPYALHLYVLFTTIERSDNMPSLLRYGLHLAATNRNITLEFPQTSIFSDTIVSTASGD